MPRIKRELIQRSEVFNALVYKAVEHRESNDCAVKALAIVTNTDYSVVHKMLAEKGRRSRKGTSLWDIYKVLDELGYKRETVEARYFIERYPAPHNRCKKFVTTHHMDNFPKVWRDGHTYLINTPGHILAVVNGVNHDWTRGTSRRAYKIERITKKES